MPSKKLLAINDISGVGKCSLTVSLPIISVSGIETSVLPTAVLSTHTGFKEFTFQDLTSNIRPTVHHWKTLNIAFDAIYSGYLGSISQVDLVIEVIAQLKTTETLIFVDPVMGDNGRLYAKFTTDFPKKMKALCQQADIITPNLTEAYALLNKPYQQGPYTTDTIQQLVTSLSALGPKIICLTGVSFQEDEIGAVIYDKTTSEIYYAKRPKVAGTYHGTGDIFASVLISALLQQQPLQTALNLAVNFTVDSIIRTQKNHTAPQFGVAFESGLWHLGQQLTT